MNYFLRILFSITFLLFIGLSNIPAQNTLVVSKKTNAQTPYGLPLINKIIFSNGVMYVNQYDGSSSLYALSNISSMSFALATAKEVDLDKEKTKKIILFPNPVCDVLTINFPASESKKNQLNIFDMQGRCVFQKEFNNQPTTININLSQLPKGLYMCCFNDGETIEVNKFIKK